MSNVCCGRHGDFLFSFRVVEVHQSSLTDDHIPVFGTTYVKFGCVFGPDRSVISQATAL